jgi:hypothetical protein
VKTLSFLLIFICASLASAQTVPSSCDAPDSVKELYRADAAVLSLYTYHPEYNDEIAADLEDSVAIPSNRIDSFLRPMIAVWNALPSFPKDSVSIIPFIHQYRNELVRDITLQVDTGSNWGKNLFNGITPTGNSTVDSLLVLYQLELDTSYKHSTNELTIMLRSKTTLNIRALIGVFSSVVDVADAYKYIMGDGDYISYKLTNDTITLVYSDGWGDCPAGCTERRSWKFTVFPDCSVRFDGSYGDPLPSWSVYEPIQKTLSLYPNPVTDKLIIEAQERGTAIISDVDGKEIRTASIIEGNNEIVVSQLPSGTYFVTIRNRNGNVTTGRFIKM